MSPRQKKIFTESLSLIFPTLLFVGFVFVGYQFDYKKTVGKRKIANLSNKNFTQRDYGEIAQKDVFFVGRNPSLVEKTVFEEMGSYAVYVDENGKIKELSCLEKDIENCFSFSELKKYLSKNIWSISFDTYQEVAQAQDSFAQQKEYSLIQSKSTIGNMFLVEKNFGKTLRVERLVLSSSNSL